MPRNHLRIVLIYPIVALFLVTAPGSVAAQDYAAAARRLAATAQLAAEEYRLGVSGGRVILPPEVEEARLFLAEARRNAAKLPARSAAVVAGALDVMDAMVTRTADPDSLAGRVTTLLEGLARDLNIVFDEIPVATPPLSRGREIYQAVCALCHGSFGRGDGPQAAAITPRPADLTDSLRLRTSSPLDFYRRITVGVAGTSMVPYEHAFSADDRWAVALYTSSLRLRRPEGQVPTALRSFQVTARMSDSSVLAALGPGATGAGLAAVRLDQGTATARTASAAVFSTVRAQLDTAYDLATSGRGEEARATAMDAYITFEQVERELAVKNPALTSQIEAAFSSLRTRAGAGTTPAQLAGIRQELARALERAERSIVDQLSPANLLLQSFVILVREGLEAILVIGALMAFLVRTGNSHRRRDIHLGVGAAIVMSLLTALALETIFVLSRSHQERLEGIVLMVATATLFYVSYWLLSKMEVAKWNSFVKGRVQDALTRGSALALVSVAFLAVYREGFETVLFYKALAVSGGPGAWAPVGGGIAAGSVVLAVVYIAINRFGIRLPLRPLFGATSGLLYYMAFVFAGKGVAELQESGAVSLTPVGGAPRLPAMGIYPTVESLALQGLLVLLAAFALFWIFILEPGRRRAR
jgi:high-affinity iron transporter